MQLPLAFLRFKVNKWMRSTAAILLIISFIGLVACATLPKDYPRSESYAFEPSTEGKLAGLAQKVYAQFGEKISGFLLLDRNDEALKWRLILADLAEHSLDIQYFIWKGDKSSVLLADRILRAADRGVRIRVLIDDLSLMGSDRDVAGLNQHPHIEVKTFNPWQRRHGSSVLLGLEFIFHLERLNHRMHNKLMVADNRVTIVGGRNIGNEYFGLNKKQNFIDLDVVAAGPIARGVSRSFDNYWNSKWAYPGKVLAGGSSAGDLLSPLRERVKEQLADASKYLDSFPSGPEKWNRDLKQFMDDMNVGTAAVVYDEPWIGADIKPVQLVESIKDIAKDAHEEVLIVSPYFIPGEDFYEGLQEVISRGVRVRILTNSLASTNHPIIVSAYKNHRKPVVEGGGELYELRHDAEVKRLYDTPPVQARWLGLHAKVIVVDRHLVFVGSLNLDPRSIYINMEMGLLIDSRRLGGRIADLIERDLRPENSWHVYLDERGRLVWESSDATVRRQPARHSGQRFQSCFFGLLPLEDQL